MDSQTRSVGAHPLKKACEAARPGRPGRSPVLGTWQMLPGANLTKIIASLGFQWLLIDMEHGAIGDTEMHNMLPAVSAVPHCHPIIRVPAPSNECVKRALDAGAHGLMFPMIETPEQAEAIVRYCRFPPQGTRGAGSFFAPTHWGLDIGQYMDSANDAVMIIVQIETPLGVENAEAIASVPGIDMLFIGPNDLSLSLGNGSKPHGQCSNVQEAIVQIREAAERAGKFSGIFCMGADEARKRFEQGFQLVNLGGDIAALAIWLKGELNKASHPAAAP